MTEPLAEQYEFQTEARQLLDLMVHSVYSNKDIFLRELISNASDAIDKLRFEALTEPALSGLTENPEIRIEADEAARTLSVSDNGIGMNREELIRFIGTIAKSGTREFAQALQEAKKSEVPPELIGQFGVGFYAGFMVADKITLVTRRAGEEHAHRWESTGDGTYTIAPDDRAQPGTTVTLHLKPADSEDGLHDYAAEWTLREIVKKYSDFVAYPVKLRVERDDKEGDGKTVEYETLNSMKAIWTRPESDVTDEEYNEFYKHISHDWTDPLKRIAMKAEGTQEFRALFFIPARAPMDLYMRDSHQGVQLYIRRVFIMHDCKELVPEYLRFIRGVVDSEDLSLNISREILQQNRQIQIIRKAAVKKILDAIRTMRTDEPDKFATFWKEFGRVVKEGIFQDDRNREAILGLTVFRSTNGDEPVSLDDYVGRMKEGQDKIYYLTGDNPAALAHSPHLEAFRAKGWEVLLLGDQVDEVWTQAAFGYKEKEFQNIARGTAEPGTAEEREKAEEERKESEKEFRPLLDALKQALSDKVKDVRLSGRLTDSPACLVADVGDMTPQMEQILKSMGQEVSPGRRILEVNAGHPILQKLHEIFEKDGSDSRLGEYAGLLFGQAVLAEGGELSDPAEFAKSLAGLMSRSLE